MGRDDKHSTKHKRHHEHRDEHERRSKKRHRSSKTESGRSSKRNDPSDKLHVVDDDPSEDMWEEKNIDMDGEQVRSQCAQLIRVLIQGCPLNQPLAADIPTSQALELTSSATAKLSDPPLPPSIATTSSIKRDEWMLAPKSDPSIPDAGPSHGKSDTLDFFSNLGSERDKKPKADAPKSDQVCSHLPRCKFLLILMTAQSWL